MKLFIQIEIYLLLFFSTFIFAQHINEGIEAFNNKRYEEAIFKLESYLKYNPKSETAYTYLAQSYLSLNKISEAKNTLEKAIKLFPKNSEFYLLLGKLYASKNQYVDAEKLLLQSIRLSPQNTEARKILSLVYFNIGVDFYSRKDLKTAESYFLKSISYDSLNENSYINTSTILMIQSKYKEAEKLATAGVKRFPQNIELKKILAETYIQLGKYKEAMNLYEIVFKNNKQDIDVGLKLALLYRYTNKIPEALSVYDTLLSFYPRERKIYNEIIDYWKLYNRQDEIRKVYHRMLKVFKDENLYSKIAETYEREAKYDSAKIIYNNILQKDSLNLHIRFAIVKLLMKEDRKDEALNELESILKIDTQNFDALKLKGEILLSLHQYEDAVNVFKYQAECYEKHYYPYFQIANYYKQAGQLDSAKKYFEISYRYNEKDPDIIEKLANVESKLNNRERANNYYKRALDIAIKNMNELQNKIAIELNKEKLDLEKLEELEPLKSESDVLEKIVRSALDYFKNTKESSDYYKMLDGLSKMYPLSLLLLIYKADYYESLSKYETSIKILKQILTVNPKLEDVHVKMAKIYEKMGKYEDASLIYWRLLTSEKSAEVAYDALINIHTQNSTLNSLCDRLLEFYKFNPANKYLRERLVEVLHKTGRLDEAKKIIESRKNE